MPEEHLKAFLEAVKADKSFQEKLRGAGDAATISDIAREAGFAIPLDEINSIQTKITETELESISGGGMCIAGANGQDVIIVTVEQASFWTIDQEPKF